MKPIDTVYGWDLYPDTRLLRIFAYSLDEGTYLELSEDNPDLYPEEDCFYISYKTLDACEQLGIVEEYHREFIDEFVTIMDYDNTTGEPYMLLKLRPGWKEMIRRRDPNSLFAVSEPM